MSKRMTKTAKRRCRALWSRFRLWQADVPCTSAMRRYAFMLPITSNHCAICSPSSAGRALVLCGRGSCAHPLRSRVVRLSSAAAHAARSRSAHSRVAHLATGRSARPSLAASHYARPLPSDPRCPVAPRSRPRPCVAPRVPLSVD